MWSCCRPTVSNYSDVDIFTEFTVCIRNFSNQNELSRMKHHLREAAAFGLLVTVIEWTEHHSKHKPDFECCTRCTFPLLFHYTRPYGSVIWQLQVLRLDDMPMILRAGFQANIRWITISLKHGGFTNNDWRCLMRQLQIVSSRSYHYIMVWFLFVNHSTIVLTCYRAVVNE